MRLTCLQVSAWVLLLGGPALRASTHSNEAILAQAEAAFARGVEAKSRILIARKQFSESADAYLELHRRGVRSSGLYFNLGNAAVLADRWPEAVWAYQVGLQLDPNGREMRDNLAFARSKVLYPPAGQGRPEPDPWPRWLPRVTIRTLALTLLSAYVLAWVAGMVALVTRRPRFYASTIFVVALAASAGAGLWIELRQAEVELATPRVVLVQNTDFYRGNALSYPRHPVLPVLPRGLEVRQVHRRGMWLQIRLTSGEVGWVHAANVLIVAP